MPDDKPLSIEGAMGMLIDKNSAAPATPDNSSAAPAASSPAPEAAAAEPEDKKDSAPADDTAARKDDAPTGDEGKQDTPEDDKGKTDGEGDDQGDALPTIEPPQSWKAEEKKVWESLPREAQQAIARREQDRTTELRNLQNQSAEQRKTVDAEVNRLKELSAEIGQHVNEQLTELARDFPDLKSEAD